MMDYNDEAEWARREHDYEMDCDCPDDPAFDRFCDKATALLIEVGVTTQNQGLDGDQETDGFSIDFAYDWFCGDGGSPADYVADVLFTRGLMGFRDGDAA